MKLRRSVIMIIACNRMKKLAKKQTSTALEEEDIHKCVTIVTNHKSAQPLNAEMAEAIFTELASASFGPAGGLNGSNGPIPRLQNQQSLSIFNCRRFDSVLQMLSVGLQNIKLLIPSVLKANSKEYDFENIPAVMTRVFQGEVHIAKRLALQIRADLVRREDEYVLCREQASLFEE